MKAVLIGDRAMSFGWSKLKAAAGIATRRLPIPQPQLLVGPGASALGIPGTLDTLREAGMNYPVPWRMRPADCEDLLRGLLPGPAPRARRQA